MSAARAVLLALGWALTAAATPSPDIPSAAVTAPPGERPAVPAPPPQVTELLGPGLSAALADLPGTDLGDLAGAQDELEAGPARPVWRWNPARVAGDDSATAVEPTGRWTATLLAGGELVGRVEVETDDAGRAAVTEVDDDPELGSDLQRIPGGRPLVDDPHTPGWYAFDGARVLPVDAAAREHLAGSLDIDRFLALGAAPEATPAPSAPAAPSHPWRLPLLAGGGVLAVLGVTAATVWLRRPDGPDDEPRTPRGMLALRRPATPAVPRRSPTADEGR